MRLLSLAILATGALAALSTGSAAQQGKEGVATFEKHIRPLLIKHCYSCHSAKAEKLKGGLLLDNRNGMMSGGDTGPAIVPGEPDQSLLLKAVRYEDEDLQMPPKYKLEESEIDALARWIKIGAPDPRSGMASATKRTIDIEAGRKFWSFQPTRKPTPPTLDDSWPRVEIDRYVLARLKKKGHNPVGYA